MPCRVNQYDEWPDGRASTTTADFTSETDKMSDQARQHLEQKHTPYLIKYAETVVDGFGCANMIFPEDVKDVVRKVFGRIWKKERSIHRHKDSRGNDVGLRKILIVLTRTEILTAIRSRLRHERRVAKYLGRIALTMEMQASDAIRRRYVERCMAYIRNRFLQSPLDDRARDDFRITEHDRDVWTECMINGRSQRDCATMHVCHVTQIRRSICRVNLYLRDQLKEFEEFR